MGYVREALLIDEASPFDRRVYLRRLPDRATILAETRDWVGQNDEWSLLMPLMLELARTQRHADIVALFEREGSALNRLQRIEEGNRSYRSLMAAIVGDSLAKLGRKREAMQLFRAADEADRVTLTNGNVVPLRLAEIAASEAMLGREARAMALLERAVAKGWFVFEGSNYRLDEVPGLTKLRGDPRFDRLVQITEAKRERERRETETLGLI